LLLFVNIPVPPGEAHGGDAVAASCAVRLLTVDWHVLSNAVRPLNVGVGGFGGGGLGFGGGGPGLGGARWREAEWQEVAKMRSMVNLCMCGKPMEEDFATLLTADET